MPRCVRRPVCRSPTLVVPVQSPKPWTLTSRAFPRMVRNNTGLRRSDFNITNGDVFTWREVWPVIADALGMKVGSPEPHSLKAEMPQHNAEWAAIVKKYKLAAPPDLETFVGKSFEFTDSIFAYGVKQPPPPMIVSTIKARKAGFEDCVDTEDMFRKWFTYYQEHRLLPPRHAFTFEMQ